MIQLPVRRGLRLAALIVLFAAAVAVGVTYRVRYLEREMLTRWQRSLEGGAITTQATVDEWFADRLADADAMAMAVDLRTRSPAGEGSTQFLGDVLAPLTRRGHFISGWAVNTAGGVVAGTSGDSLRVEERAALREAIAEQHSTHTAIMRTGPHAALLSLAAPVHRSPRMHHSEAPAAILLRADVVKAMVPWAGGRPNAAMSRLSTPSDAGVVVVSACPDQAVSVCIGPPAPPAWNSPSVLARAGQNRFGKFIGESGQPVLAVTRFDEILGWGVIRQIDLADARVPLETERNLESAFLAILLALLGVGALAANRTVRVRRLDAKREAADRLAIVVDASTDGIISLDQNFTITMVNTTVERMLGRHRSSLLGRPVLDLFASEWHASLDASLRAFATSDHAHAPLADTERCVALSADGTEVPVEARIGRATIGDVRVFVVGLRDVTQQVRAEAFFKGERHVLELMAAGAPVTDTLDALLAVVLSEAPRMRCAVYRLDDDGTVAHLLVARRLPAQCVAALERVPVGPTASGIGSVTDRGEAMYSATVATDPLWRHSGELLSTCGIQSAWGIPLRAVGGRVIGAMACYYDDSRNPSPRERELVRAAVHLASIALSGANDEIALRKSEAGFRSFVENAPTAIFREAATGELVSSNPTMVALLGYGNPSELALAARRGGLYHDPADRQRLIDALRANEVVRMVELEWMRADRTAVKVRVSARAFKDARGEVWQWEGYAEDVTSLRAAEVAVHRNERLAAVGQLISGVAHELNNPLTAILHFAEDLLADPRSAGDIEALGVIRDQARRSRAIVRDLLSFVRQRESNPVPVLLSGVVADTVRAMTPALAEAGVVVQLEARGSDPSVLADRSAVEQVIANLVSNAAHAAGRNGTVWIVTERTTAGCELTVDDNGAGIPPDVLPRIFDPFFTTKQTGVGTGLGLSVTLGIVEQLGGRIVVGNRPGGPGTRVTVSLPSVAAPFVGMASLGDLPSASFPTPTPANTGTPERALSLETAGRNGVALIIDDEPAIRGALRRFFVRRGWDVEEAPDGASGCALLDQHGERYGVVISDLRMPNFSGIELHDHVQVTQPALLRRFVFGTGDVASEEAARFVQRTTCHVLQKPFELRMLDEILARIVRSERA